MIIQTTTHTAIVSQNDDIYRVTIFANGITPVQINERNWSTLEAAEKDAKWLMRLSLYNGR